MAQVQLWKCPFAAAVSFDQSYFWMPLAGVVKCLVGPIEIRHTDSVWPWKFDAYTPLVNFSLLGCTMFSSQRAYVQRRRAYFAPIQYQQIIEIRPQRWPIQRDCPFVHVTTASERLAGV